MGQRRHNRVCCNKCERPIPIREKVSYCKLERVTHPYSATIAYYCEDCWATYIALLLGITEDPRVRADRPIRHPVIRGRTLNRKERI